MTFKGALIGLIVCVNCCSYTKPKGQLPDYTAPVVLANGKNTVEDFCNNIHKSILKEFKQWVVIKYYSFI